eukprot:Phypoly_transcript_00030.p1 GENE.Phypoly_transcript_00030~~Phypoly_transcript_00030.p1  ORF type:complete len:1571 (+),score=474.31 Phypoly_transcript_00030:66-4778(+)
MYILRADTGQAIEVNVSPGESVQSLRERIAAIAPIAPGEQILLSTGGKRLDPNKTLEFYGLPSKEKEIFLFNWRAISDPNFPIEDSAPLPIETQVPPLRPLSKEFENRPLIHALKSYEHQFHGHYLIAQAICEAFERRLYTCKMCFSEVHVQVRGIECAVLNLRNHMGQLVHSQEEFLAHAKLQIKEGEELLEQWDNDLAQLKDVHIHPSLATPGTTLLDLIPEARLRAWAKDSVAETEQVKIRIPPMENQLRQFQQEVEEEIQKPNDVDLRELSDRIFHSEEILKDIMTKVQMFAKDFENVRTRVEIALRNTQGQSLGNFCEGFDEIAKVHEAHLSYLRAQDEASKENFLVFARCKAKVSRGVYMRIRSVSAFQARIRESFNLMTVMGEAKNRLVATFSQLSVVKNMPQAYQAAIQEVARRRGFSKKVRRELLRMNETVGKVRDEELPKRERFMNKYFHFVPKDLVPGLQDALPVLEVSVPPFDTNLPQIDSTSTSGEEDDFTIVPFGDEPIPRMQSFDKENAFSQSGSNNYNSNNNNNNNPYPTPSPYYSNPPMNPPPSTNPTPSSNPIPITSTKGTTNPVHTSGGPLSVSPGSDLKLQKDLAAANQLAANYADRIKHLEGEINKLYREKVERTQQKLEGAHIGGSQFDAEMRNLLSVKEDTIRSLKAELDTMREKEKSEYQPDPETESLRTKVFEQERQIERLMIALHTTPEPLVVSARSAPTQAQGADGEVKRLLAEIEEWKKREAGWEEERKEAAVKYEGMMKQLTGELDHLREEKLNTSRSWINEKLELEKAQKAMEKMREAFAGEKLELEAAIKDLQQTMKQQEEAWGTEKRDLEKRIAEIKAASAVDSEKWAKEKGTMLEDFNKEKQGLSEEREKKEAELRKDLGDAQGALEQLRKELDTLQNEAKTLRDDLASAAQTIKEKDEAAEKLEKAKRDLLNAVANLESVMEQKDKTALSVSQDLTALRKTHEEAEARASALQNKCDDIQTRCTELSARKEELEKSLEGLKGERQELSERLERTNQTHAQELENLNATLRAKDAALTDAAANLRATSEKLKEKEEETNKREVEGRTVGKELQDAQRELQDAQKSLREKDEAIASSGNALREKDAALRASEFALRDKEAALLQKDVALREKDAAIAQGEEALREKDATLHASEEALREKTAALQASEEALREKDAALRESEEALREKDAAIAQGEEMSRSVANLSELLETKEKGFSEGVLDYERKLMEMEERQKQEEMDRYRMFELEREELLNAHNLKVQQLQLQITELQNELKKQDSGNQILALKNEATELKTTITGLQTQLKDMGIAHTQEMDGLAQKYAKKEAEINEISVQIQKKNSALEKRIQDTEEEKRRMQQQLEQYTSSQNKADQLRRVVVELSENLKNHTACQNLQDKGTDEITQFQTRVSAIIAFAHGLEEERDHAAVQHMTEASQLRTLLQTKEDRVADLERRLQDAQGQLTAWEMSQNENVPSKISFSKFKAGDLVLFVPKNKSHEAFNINCPNYYLSEDCATLYENQTYVCGQIIEINSRKATARDNPFKLPEGTEFHEVTITSI